MSCSVKHYGKLWSAATYSSTRNSTDATFIHVVIAELLLRGFFWGRLPLKIQFQNSLTQLLHLKQWKC